MGRMTTTKVEGRNRIPLDKILRIYFIQNQFSLSDSAAEQKIYNNYTIGNIYKKIRNIG
jgi:hypothetical protein